MLTLTCISHVNGQSATRQGDNTINNNNNKNNNNKNNNNDTNRVAQEWSERQERLAKLRVVPTESYTHKGGNTHSNALPKPPPNTNMTSHPVPDRPYLQRLHLVDTRTNKSIDAVYIDMEQLSATFAHEEPTKEEYDGDGDVICADAKTTTTTTTTTAATATITPEQRVVRHIPELRRMASEQRHDKANDLMAAGRDRLTAMWLLPQINSASAIAALLDLPDSKQHVHLFYPSSTSTMCTLQMLASEFVHLGPSPTFVSHMLHTLQTEPDEKDEEMRALITLELQHEKKKKESNTAAMDTDADANVDNWPAEWQSKREKRIANAREQRVLAAHKQHQERIQHRCKTTAHTLSSVWFAKEFSTFYTYEHTLWRSSGSDEPPTPVSLDDVSDPQLQHIVSHSAMRAILSEYTWRHTLLFEAQAVALQGLMWGAWPDVLVSRTKNPLHCVPRPYSVLYSPRPDVARAFDVHASPDLLQNQLGFLATLDQFLLLDKENEARHLHTPPRRIAELLKDDRYNKTEFADWSTEERNILEMQVLLYFLQVLVHPLRATEARDAEYSKNQMLKVTKPEAQLSPGNTFSADGDAMITG